MKRYPIRYVSQLPGGNEDGPISFLFNIAGPLGLLQGEMHWMFHDFCRVHQIVYKRVGEIEKWLDAVDIEGFLPTADIESEVAYGHSKIIEVVRAQDMENERVVSFVDQMAVVGLWAISEQFLGKIYRGFKALTDACKPEQVTAPYRWDDFVSSYMLLGIDLHKCENYGNADECRVVNNTIKHDSVVSSRLAAYPYFSAYRGKKLEKVPLEMQRYLNGVSDFLGSLLENSNSILTKEGF